MNYIKGVLVLCFFFLAFDLLAILYALSILDLGYVLIFGWMFIFGSVTLYVRREEIVRKWSDKP